VSKSQNGTSGYVTLAAQTPWLVNEEDVHHVGAVFIDVLSRTGWAGGSDLLQRQFTRLVCGSDSELPLIVRVQSLYLDSERRKELEPGAAISFYVVLSVGEESRPYQLVGVVVVKGKVAVEGVAVRIGRHTPEVMTTYRNRKKGGGLKK